MLQTNGINQQSIITLCRRLVAMAGLESTSLELGLSLTKRGVTNRGKALCTLHEMASYTPMLNVKARCAWIADLRPCSCLLIDAKCQDQYKFTEHCKILEIC